MFGWCRSNNSLPCLFPLNELILIDEKNTVLKSLGIFLEFVLNLEMD